jgi:hypothetical protein
MIQERTENSIVCGHQVSRPRDVSFSVPDVSSVVCPLRIALQYPDFNELFAWGKECMTKPSEHRFSHSVNSNSV